MFGYDFDWYVVFEVGGVCFLVFEIGFIVF